MTHLSNTANQQGTSPMPFARYTPFVPVDVPVCAATTAVAAATMPAAAQTPPNEATGADAIIVTGTRTRDRFLAAGEEQ